MTFPSDLPNKGTGTKLLTSSQVAKRLQVSAKSLYIWMDENKFPKSVRIGQMHRWRESDIEAWLEGGGSDVSTD